MYLSDIFTTLRLLTLHEVLGASDDDLGLVPVFHTDLVCGSPLSDDHAGKAVEPGVRHSAVDAGVDDDVDFLSGLEGLESPGDGGDSSSCMRV